MLGKSTSFGRNKDKTVEDQLRSFGIEKDQMNERGQPQYVDKQGRKLTIKEAFRQLCWKFHGKMPSHRKQEKRRLKQEEEQKKAFSTVNIPDVAGSNALAAKLPKGKGT